MRERGVSKFVGSSGRWRSFVRGVMGQDGVDAHSGSEGETGGEARFFFVKFIKNRSRALLGVLRG